jgi:flagellar motor switch protein FliN/FliY
MAEDEDMLSEDEIDALLDDAEEGEEPEESGDEESGGEASSGGTGMDEMSVDNIRPVYEEIADSMENILGTILNREVTNQLVDCQFQSVDDVEDALGERNWVVIESELSGPVEGVARYILPEEQALKLADVMMGQEGDEPPEEFDEVYESAIVEMYNQVVNSLANKLNDITGEDIELNPPESNVLSTEEFLDGIDLDEFLWVEYSFSVEDLVDSGVLFELQPSEIAELIHASAVEEEDAGGTDEPAEDTGGESESTGGAQTADAQPQASGGGQAGEQKEVKNVEFPQFEAGEGEEPVGNMNLLMDVPMEVSVELGRTDLQVKEILDLGAGSIIELERLAGEPVDLLVNGRLVARGEVVVIDENFGVRVTSIVSPMERIK